MSRAGHALLLAVLLACHARAHSTPAPALGFDEASASSKTAAAAPQDASPDDSRDNKTPATLGSTPSKRIHGGPPMNTARTYFTQWASPSRSSHVPVPMVRAKGLERIADWPSKVQQYPIRTAFLLVGPDRVWASDFGGLVLERSNGAVVATGAGGNVGCLTPTGAVFMETEFDRDGKPTGRTIQILGDPGFGRFWLEFERGDTVWRVFQRGITNGGPLPRLEVLLDRFVPGASEAEVLAINEVENARAMAAMLPDDRVAVATTERAFVLFGAVPDEVSGALPVQLRHKLSFAPYEIAVVSDRVALLEAHGVAVEHGPYLLQTDDDLFGRWREIDAFWTTRLHVVNSQGQELEGASVPFAVLQPPIDGEDGRIYLAGMGFAAVEHGATVYVQRSSTACLATAFKGGDVALAVGRDLRFIARDATVRQSFQVPQGETIRTPPAIGPDGDVWVGTEKALYVAR